jgi:hypothetical protein
LQEDIKHERPLSHTSLTFSASVGARLSPPSDDAFRILQVNETEAKPTTRNWLGATPFVVAGALALIYALGAVAVYGQLRHAGLNALQTMPLVPVEQLLGRGIGSLVSIFGRALTNFVLAVLMVAAYWSDRDERVIVHPKDWSKWMWLLPISFAFIAIFGSWGLALVVSVGLATQWGALAIAGVNSLGGVKALVLVASASLLSLVPMSLAVSLVEPSPLPRIEIIRTDGTTVHGELVAETGNVWYVAKPDHTIGAIPNGYVSRTSIEYEDRDTTPSLWSEVF